MDYLKIILSSLLSLAALFLSAKVIGNKQMSQLNMFDYINGITIGSIAADMAIDAENNILFPIIAITIYTLINVLISYISSKSIRARKFLNGQQIILMDKGKLLYDNFKTAKIDLDEFLTQCRINGCFNICDVDSAILEQNGMISFLMRSDAKPLTPHDMSLEPNQEKLFHCVISDGKIIEDALISSGLTLDKLHTRLRRSSLDVSDVFAALYDGETISIFEKSNS